MGKSDKPPIAVRKPPPPVSSPTTKDDQRVNQWVDSGRPPAPAKVDRRGPVRRNRQGHQVERVHAWIRQDVATALDQHCTMLGANLGVVISNALEEYFARRKDGGKP